MIQNARAARAEVESGEVSAECAGVACFPHGQVGAGPGWGGVGWACFHHVPTSAQVRVALPNGYEVTMQSGFEATNLLREVEEAGKQWWRYLGLQPGPFSGFESRLSGRTIVVRPAVC